MRSNIEGSRIAASLLMEKNRLGFTLVPATGDITIDDDMPPFVMTQSTAAINVKMPVVTAALTGLWFLIGNRGAGTLTFQTSSGGALAPTVTVPTERLSLMICDGVEWRSLVSQTS